MKDLTGKVFGRLTAIKPVHQDKHGNWCWYCLCTCGTVKVVRGYCLTQSVTRSCGCFNSEVAAARRTTHGMSKTAIYCLWRTMVDRCHSTTSCGYAAYGAVGITVCERWRTFENFYADMGARPGGRSLERRDNSGNYEPNNCYWATVKEQGRNTKRNMYLTHKGKTQCLSAWCEELELTYSTIYWRIKAGWSVGLAFEGKSKEIKCQQSH